MKRSGKYVKGRFTKFGFLVKMRKALRINFTCYMPYMFKHLGARHPVSVFVNVSFEFFSADRQ